MKNNRNIKKRQGTVKSLSSDKTIVVVVTRRLRHPLYKKVITRTKRFLVHDEKNTCKIGQNIEIIETKPYSKRKKWKVNA